MKIRKFLLLISLLVIASCGSNSEEVISGNTMGTTYTVKLVMQSGDSPGAHLGKGEELRVILDNELQRINQLMSTYDATSELSRFNMSALQVPFLASSDTIEVLEMSAMINAQSQGAFDVTVGPLVNLWGFGPDAKPAQLDADEGDSIPSNRDISAALARTGFNQLEIKATSLTKRGDVYVDLSAIAKGYAVDRLADILNETGFENYLVEVGGELRAHGLNSRSEPWTVAIEKPDSLSRSIFKIIELRDMSMATSGDYRNYFEVDGVRYSHTIDPRTGRPITHSVVSVSVIAPSAALADGYATAIDVLGKKAGLALAEAQNLAVLVIIKTENGFEEFSSTALDEYLGVNEELPSDNPLSDNPLSDNAPLNVPGMEESK